VNEKSSYFAVEESVDILDFKGEAEQQVVNVGDLHHDVLVVQHVALYRMSSAQQRQMHHNQKTLRILWVQPVILFKHICLLSHVEILLESSPPVIVVTYFIFKCLFDYLR